MDEGFLISHFYKPAIKEYIKVAPLQPAKKLKNQTSIGKELRLQMNWYTKGKKKKFIK